MQKYIHTQSASECQQKSDRSSASHLVNSVQNVLLHIRDSTFRCFRVPSDRPFFFLCLPLLSVRTLLFLCSHHFQLTACGSTGVTSLLSPFRKHTIFPPWWKCQPASADILLTGLSFQEEEARFASQEVDVDLEQLRRRGYPPRSLDLRRVSWWGKFLKERTR